MNLEKNINNKLSLYFIIFLMFLGCEINKKSVFSLKDLKQGLKPIVIINKLDK